MINGLCDFVDNIFSSETTSLSSLVVTGLAEVEIQLFTWPSHNLRWFFTLNYQSAKYGGCKPCGSKDIIEVGRKVAYDYLIRKVRQISFVYFVDIVRRNSVSSFANDVTNEYSKTTIKKFNHHFKIGIVLIDMWTKLHKYLQVFHIVYFNRFRHAEILPNIF